MRFTPRNTYRSEENAAIELVLFKHQYANIYNSFGIPLRRIAINIGIPYHTMSFKSEFKNFSLVSVAAAQ